MSNWKEVKLGSLCNLRRGASPRPISDSKYFGAGAGWVRISDVTSSKKYLKQTSQRLSSLGESKSVRVVPGDVIMSICATIGKPVIVDMDACIHDGFVVFKDLNPEVDNEFLTYWLNMKEGYFNSLGQHGIQKNLNTSIINNTLIKLPTLKEQQKIAEILSSVDAAIEKTEQVIAKTEEVKKGLMQQLLTKGIGHTEFKDSKVGLIPKSWHLIDFIGVADSNIDYSFTGGPFGSDLKSEDYTENGVRIIQLQNIKDGYFNDDYKIFTSEEKANKLKSCNIYSGEIIIAKMADPLARACLVPDKDSRYLMASDGIRLSIDKCKFDTDFVLYSINSIYFRNQAEEVSTGTTRLRIGLSALKKLQFKVPPLEEQKRIASIILSFDNKIKSEQEKLIKLKECKKGLMQQLLTGQVRVKID